MIWATKDFILIILLDFSFVWAQVCRRSFVFKLDQLANSPELISSLLCWFNNPLLLIFLDSQLFQGNFHLFNNSALVLWRQVQKLIALAIAQKNLVFVFKVIWTFGLLGLNRNEPYIRYINTSLSHRVIDGMKPPDFWILTSIKSCRHGGFGLLIY